MDPRGTGLSNQISIKNLAKVGGPKEQARYLSFFRCVRRMPPLTHSEARYGHLAACMHACMHAWLHGKKGPMEAYHVMTC